MKDEFEKWIEENKVESKRIADLADEENDIDQSFVSGTETRVYRDVLSKYHAFKSKQGEEKAKGDMVEGICGTCNGRGLIPIGGGVRGLRNCETCGGKGKMTGIRPADTDKPPAPASLVEELREIIKDCKGRHYEYEYPASLTVDEVEEILSRHARRTEVVLHRFPADNVCRYVEIPKEISQKRGKLIFVEDEK